MTWQDAIHESAQANRFLGHMSLPSSGTCGNDRDAEFAPPLGFLRGGGIELGRLVSPVPANDRFLLDE